jgi:hypothetical protein
VPFGRTTGWPPSPVAPPLGASAEPHASPPFVEVFIRMELPLMMSYCV